MNKFEKLVEYIINDEDQKARELFHAIVVEKSRDIYESIMDEEHMEEMVHGDEIGDMDKEISAEETMHEEEGTEEEFSMDDEGDGEMPADDDHGDEEPMHMGGEEAEHEEIEDKVMNIDTKLDELLAKFDEIMGDKGHDDMDHEEPAGEETPDWDDMGGEEEHPGAEAEHDMMEAEGSGKSGMSGKSGKSGSAMSGKSGKSGSGKTAVDMMREYVEKIEDITLTPSTYSEGEPVGSTGKKTSVNTKSVSRHEGPDFGGESKNIARGGSNENPDGKPVPKANNEYTKGQGEIKSGNRNVPGGKAGKPESTGHEYTKDAKGAEGQTTGGKVPVYDKSVQKQNTGRK